MDAEHQLVSWKECHFCFPCCGGGRVNGDHVGRWVRLCVTRSRVELDVELRREAGARKANLDRPERCEHARDVNQPSIAAEFGDMITYCGATTASLSRMYCAGTPEK